MLCSKIHTGGFMDSILFERFKNVNFTKSQRKIAQFMMDNEYELCQMSLMDVSKAVGVSDASVLRLVRLVGFDGYNDFKRELYDKLVQQAGAPVSTRKSLKDRLSDTPSGDLLLLPLVIENTKHNVESTLQQNSPNAYDDAVSTINRSRRIIIYGCRGTLDEARHFARCLRYVRGNVVFLEHYDDVHPALAYSGPEDVLVFFCVSRFYETDVHICQAANSKDIPIILITDLVPSVISGHADSILRAKVDGLSYFNSMVGILAIAEYLLIRIKNNEENDFIQEQLDFIDRYTESERCI